VLPGERGGVLAELRLRDVLLRNVDCYGAEPAVVCGDEVVTWRGLAERVFRLAGRMAHDGIGRGDRVGVLQGNGPEIGEVAFAAALLGSVLVPISPRLTSAEVAYLVKDAELRLAFVERGHPSTDGFGDVPIVATRGADYAGYRDQGPDREPVEQEDPGDPVLQLYTSGTTGRPKGALLTQRALIQNGLTIQLSQQLTHDDVFLTTTPLTHAAAGTRIFSLAVDGLTHAILERFTPELFFEAVRRHRVTSTIVVPTMLRDLVDSPALPGADLSSLRFVVYGAAPASEELILDALDRLPCGLLQGYGLTEGCPALASLSPDEHRRFAVDPAQRRRLQSVGRPVPGVRFRVVGPAGEPLGPDAAGEIQVRSTKSMTGYWHLPEETAGAAVDGWLSTGDVGMQDAGGYLYLLGRHQDVIISGGFNVYPAEIERVLGQHGAVREVAVVGVPDARWGEVPVAVVVADTAVTTDELLRHCAGELADYKRPRRIELVDALPRNETGKVLKRELREAMARPLTT